MEMTLFVIVGAIALLSAAMMLISENAIYSALFLIVNFACIAFFFLMLNAVFLMIVQVAVYAGAIMVLFLFVIMLLGAERLVPANEPHMQWMTPAVVVLSLALAITIGVAILHGDVTTAGPDRIQAAGLRVVQAVDGLDKADIYLNGRRVAQGLAFGDHTDFEQWQPGTISAAVYRAGDDPAQAQPVIARELVLAEGQALSVVAVGRLNMPGNEPQLVAAPHALKFPEKSNSLSLLVVNGVPDYGALDVVDVTHGGARSVLAEGVPYGQSAEVSVRQGDYDIGLYPTGNERNPVVKVDDARLQSDTAVLWVVAERRQPDNSFREEVITIAALTNPVFGSPAHVGRTLFRDYVLPFEMVALLLLVAMIGAIVLTHEKLAPPRARMARRLANPSATLEQPIEGEPGK